MTMTEQVDTLERWLIELYDAEKQGVEKFFLSGPRDLVLAEITESTSRNGLGFAMTLVDEEGDPIPLDRWAIQSFNEEGRQGGSTFFIEGPRDWVKNEAAESVSCWIDAVRFAMTLVDEDGDPIEDGETGYVNRTMLELRDCWEEAHGEEVVDEIKTVIAGGVMPDRWWVSIYNTKGQLWGGFIVSGPEADARAKAADGVRQWGEEDNQGVGHWDMALDNEEEVWYDGDDNCTID